MNRYVIVSIAVAAVALMVTGTYQLLGPYALIGWGLVIFLVSIFIHDDGSE